LLAPGDVDYAGKDDHKSGTNMSGRKDRFAGGKAADLAEPTRPFDLKWIEIGEHLVAPPLENRLDRQRHSD
jgi:hypothetical protein